MTTLQQTTTIKHKSNCVQPYNRQNKNNKKNKKHKTCKVSNTLLGVLIAEVLWHNQADASNYPTLQPSLSKRTPQNTPYKFSMPNQFLLITPHQSKTGPNDSSISNMATLPQSAFAACKLREQYHERDYILSRMKTAGTDKNDLKSSADNQPQMDYTPVKYNEKLMNSIWGFYNRLSPHNVKMNEYVATKKY